MSHTQHGLTIKGLAFAHKKGYKFDLILAGKIEKKALEIFFKLAEHLDIKDYLFYKGTYNQNNAPKIYQSSDAYVMLKYKDPSPNVVVEAMSCGLPILFSLSGGVPELVGEKSGVGLKVKDSWTRGDIVPKTNHIGEGMIKIFKK